MGWKKGAFGPHRCLDVNMLTYWSAGMSIAQDIAILILPLPVVATLNLPRRTKLGACFMFSLGVFVLVASCARLRAIHAFGDSPNPTWDYSDAVIWTGLEVAVSIVVASLPPIRAMVGRWRKKRAERRRRGGRGRGRQGRMWGLYRKTASADRGSSWSTNGGGGSWEGLGVRLATLSSAGKRTGSRGEEEV